MIVWTVFCSDNSDSDLRYTSWLVDIYATEELAEEAVDNLNDESDERFDYYYTDYEVTQ